VELDAIVEQMLERFSRVLGALVEKRQIVTGFQRARWSLV